MFGRLVKSFVAGAFVGLLVVVLFPGAVAYFLSGSSHNFAFVNFFSTGAYVVSFGGKHGVMVPVEDREFVGVLNQLFSAVSNDQIRAVSSAIGGDYTLSDVVSFVSKNFTYNESARTSFMPLSRSMMPEEFLKYRTGVCGDYAFFYAAAVLGCCSEVTVRIILPGEGVGHIFAIYDGTALGYSGVDGVKNEMLVWYQEYSSAAVLDVVLTYNGSSAFPVSASLWSFSNRYTLYYPSRVTVAVVTYVSSGRTLGVVTRSDLVIYPLVVGSTTFYGDTVTVVGRFTYFLSDSMFGAARGDVSFFIRYYGVGTTGYYYGFVLSPRG